MRRRLVAVPLTMGGMLFFALLVGLMSDGVSARVDYLHKGANPVIEENHTIIIGMYMLCGPHLYLRGTFLRAP